MSTAHRPWPYPRNREEIIQAVVFAVAAVFISILGLAVLAHHYETKDLNAQNFRQAAEQLSSFAREGAITARQAAHGRSLQNYQVSYLTNLHDQAANVGGFLASHETSPRWRGLAYDLSNKATHLQDLLRRTAEEDNTEHLLTNAANLDHLQRDLQELATEASQ